MGYLDSGAERSALAALPLDSSIRNVPIELLIARLKSERGLIEAETALQPAQTELAAILLVERSPDEALARSIRALALQSHPQVRCVVVPSRRVDLAALRRFVDAVELRPASLEVWPDLDAPRRAELAQASFVTFLRHGDRLHPSAAAWLAVERTAGRVAEVVTWGEIQPDGGGRAEWAQRNPDLHLISLLHFPYLRNAFAVAGEQVAAYPGDLLREAALNDLHLFQIWLARREAVRWYSHPEFFLVRADARIDEHPERAAWRAYDASPDAYAAIFATSFPGLGFHPAPRDDAAPYRLTPRRVPASLTVVIPFRDKAQLTARAARSVAAQTFPGSIEILLINNQSSSHSLGDLRAELARVPPGAQWRIVDFDAPFNHSAQCTLGVREGRGEVVLFMNNDAELDTAGALVELAAWAAWPGVGSVGAALEDHRTQKVAAGMEVRLGQLHHLDSIVEERSDPALTPYVREVFGNSFAFAAVSREVFDALGGLDAQRFPNGYNDVDFACRARRAKLVHVALGHVRVRHPSGQSRVRTDEVVQRTLLRTRYPEFSAAGLTDLRFDDTLIRKPRGAQAAPAPDSPASAAGAASGVGKAAQLLRPLAAIAGLLPLRGRSRRARDDARLVAASALFDRQWYLARNPGVAASKMDPALHYVLHGAAEGCDPGPGFDTRWYLETHRDVAEAGHNPLVHYLRHGKGEGRGVARSSGDPRTSALPAATTEEALVGEDPLSVSLAAEPTPSWRSREQLVRGELDPPSASALAALEQMMSAGSAEYSAAGATCPVVSLESAAMQVAMADVWHTNERDLRFRFASGARGQACVARFFQQDPASGRLVVVGESLLSGGGADFADVAPTNPFHPLLLTLATCEGRTLAASLLPFPSLCRGGLHYGELCVTGSAPTYLENLQLVSQSLLRELLGAPGRFSIARIEIDLSGAIGSEHIFAADLRDWLARVLHVGVGPVRASASPAAPKVRSYLEESLVPSAAARSGSAVLTLPADAIPAIHALVARRLAGRGTCAVGSFVVADASTASPRWTVSVPPMGDDLVALQPASVAVAFPVVTPINPGERADADETPDASPLAVRFRDGRDRHLAGLIMPVAPDAPGPLLRCAASGERRSITVSVVVAPKLRAAGAFAAFLESLAFQTMAENVEVVAAPERGPAAGKRAIEGALWRLFAGRYRLVEPGRNASHNARINRAAGRAAGRFLLIAGANVALHDARTLETLCAMADHDRVASAGCVLLQAAGARKVPGFRSAGIFLTRPPHPSAQGAVFSELDCLDAFGVATYPVAANASALFMVRADVWRSLGGFDAGRYPGAGEGDLDYGVRAIARGFLHLCTSVVSAELYDQDFRGARTAEAADSFVPAEAEERLLARAGQVAVLKA